MSKHILFDEEDQSDDDNFEKALNKKQFHGKKGKMLMELQMSYRNDERFNFDRKFKGDVDKRKISKNLKNISTAFDAETQDQEEDKSAVNKPEDIIGEKNKNLSILSQVISNTEFLTHNKKYSVGNAKNLIIKRFDPNLKIGKDLEMSKKDLTKKSEKNVIKINRGVDKLRPSTNKHEETNKNSHKNKKIIQTMFNELNDHLENKKIEIKYDSWKNLANENKDVGFGLFGGEVEVKKVSKIGKAKNPITQINPADEQKPFNLFEEPTPEFKGEEEIKLLKSKRKKEKKKQKAKEKKNKEKQEKEIKDVKVVNKLKSNLLKEFDQDKVDNYLRYSNMVRDTKYKNK